MEKLFCVTCGEESEFTKKWTQRNIEYDCESSCDNGGGATDNWDQCGCCEDEGYEEDEVYECGNCSDEVDFMSEPDIDEARYLHTDKDGEWSEDELEEDERNEEIGREIGAKRI